MYVYASLSLYIYIYNATPRWVRSPTARATRAVAAPSPPTSTMID